MEQQREGQIVGRPTLLATFESRLDSQAILDSLKSIGYPLEDVSVYYRPKGSDQVIDAATGHVAAGQALTEEELDRKKTENVDTLVLMHPTSQQYEAVQQALLAHGNSDIKYVGETHAESSLEGVQRHDEQVLE